MDIGQMLKAISEPTRYKIVQLLLERHHCSRSLALTLGISESAVSQHMSILKKLGIVTSFRHGYHIHYVLSREAVEAIVGELNGWLSKLEEIGDCHEVNPCDFKMENGTSGCLYEPA